MTPEMQQEAAALLVAARRTAVPLDALPAACRPQSADEAYAIQDIVTRELGGAGGWKVGAAGPAAEPNCSPIPKSMIVASGHTFPAGTFRLNGIEGELAFTLARDLPPRPAGYSVDEVAAAIASIHAVIEVIDTRFDDMRTTDPLSLLADSGSNGALVVGPPATGNIRVDQTRQPVELFVNDGLVFSALGGNSAGDVFRLLAWLANHLTARCGGLRAGQVVTSGSCTGVRFAAPGDRVRVRFPGVGEAGLAFGA